MYRKLFTRLFQPIILRLIIRSVFLCLIYFLTVSSALCITTIPDTSIVQNPVYIAPAENLLLEKKYEELLALSNQSLDNIKHQELDSFEIASWYFYQFESNYYLDNFLSSIKSANRGINFCPNTRKGNLLRGILFYKKAYGEDALNYDRRSAKSMQQSVNVWDNMTRPQLDYQVGAYIFLSSNASYLGNLEEAQRYLRLAEKIYATNKDVLDQLRTDPDGGYDRYEVMLKYRKIYQLYKLGKSTQDSLALLTTLNELRRLHQQPEFHTYERIYYTSSLNHVGTWFLERRPDSTLLKAEILKGLEYIEEAIDLIDKKGYPGNRFTFYFNKCKGLTYINELEKAETIINQLWESLSSSSSARSFCLAQKGLIHAKAQQKDSALVAFYQAIGEVHTGKDELKKDYSNFKPSTIYGETRLLLRIAEKLNQYYKNDKEVQVVIAKLYFLALLQYEESHQVSQFSPKNNLELRQIVQGILSAKQQGLTIAEIPIPNLLNRTETILNRLAWKRFYQNAHTTSLSQLDSITQIDLDLRKQLVTAKRKGNQAAQDSLQQLIYTHLENTQKRYTNFNLLSDQSFNIKDLQKKLSPTQTILKYLLLNQQMVVFVISSDHIQWKLHPWTIKEKQLTQSFIKELKTQQYSSKNATALYQLLLPKLPANTQQLIINPDGLLNQLPFETLQKKGDFLIADYTLHYTSNLGFIYPLDFKNELRSDLSIYVPQYISPEVVEATRKAPMSLLGAQAEAKAISRLLPSTIYAGREVTKQQFFNTAPQAGLLHLAMHAVVNNEDSSLSHLLFTDEQATEQRLYLEELYALQFKADLAVLSACGTGLGKEDTGNRMESFQRAFTFSGVPSTVASLWDVPDLATQQIMEAFYQYLQQGDSKSVALQKAKQTYLKNTSTPQLREPYYWAGFVLYGQDTPIVIKRWYQHWLVWVLILSLLLGMIVWKKSSWLS